MEVQFKTRNLRKQYQDSDAAIRRWGSDVARRYIARISQLYAMNELTEADSIISLRPHPLNGSRKGELSIHLTGTWQLILKAGDAGESVTIMGVSEKNGD